MRRALLVVVAVAIVAIAVVAFAPATVAGVWIERASRGAIVLADAEGTLWRGRGTLVGGSGRFPFRWAIDVWPLLRGEVSVSLLPFDAGAATPRGRIAVRNRAIAVRELDATLPAALATFATPLHATGEAHLVVPSLDWSPGSANGSLQVDWRDARVGIGGDGGIDLGSVNATLSGDGAALRGPIANDGGDVALQGVAGWQPGSLEASLLLAPRRSDDAVTRGILAALGTPEGAGYRVLLGARAK